MDSRQSRQESIAVVAQGDHTRFRLAEPSSTIFCHHVIDPIPKAFGKEPEEAEDRPGAGKPSEYPEHGIRLCMTAGFIDQDDGLRCDEIFSTSSEQLSARLGLQRREFKGPLPVAFQDELDGACAKIADAIVEDYSISIHHAKIETMPYAVEATSRRR
jgi:hypothetical protein